MYYLFVESTGGYDDGFYRPHDSREFKNSEELQEYLKKNYSPFNKYKLIKGEWVKLEINTEHSFSFPKDNDS